MLTAGDIHGGKATWRWFTFRAARWAAGRQSNTTTHSQAGYWRTTIGGASIAGAATHATTTRHCETQQLAGCHRDDGWRLGKKPTASDRQIAGRLALKQTEAELPLRFSALFFRHENTSATCRSVFAPIFQAQKPKGNLPFGFRTCFSGRFGFRSFARPP